MAWGGLNPALTSWRNGLQLRFPRRGRQSDGGYADKVHGSSSQHQADGDGTVDAFDCDVNFLGSTVESGNATERRIAEAVKADFEDDPRAQLWIHQREIANDDVDDWRERDYEGPSPHDHHIHFQSKQRLERDGRPWKMPRTDALLRQLNKESTVSNPITTADAALVTRNLLGTKIGESGPTVGVALQSGYQNSVKLVAAVTAEAQRDATTVAILAGMQSALSALASANGALTAEQVAALTEQVSQAAAAAGAEAVSVLEAKLDSLRDHLGDESPA